MKQRFQKAPKMIKTKLIALTAFMSCSALLVAQSEETEGADFIYDASFSYLLGDVPTLENKWYSNGHAFSFMGEARMGSHAAFGYGLGLSVYVLHNNLNYTKPERDGTPGFSTFTISPDSAVNVNEQMLNYIDVPLEFRFRTRPNERGNDFNVTIGARIGYRYMGNAYHRSGDYAIRQYRILGESRWRLQPYARIGWGEFALFAGLDLLYNLEQWTSTAGVGNYNMVSAGLSIQL